MCEGVFEAHVHVFRDVRLGSRYIPAKPRSQALLGLGQELWNGNLPSDLVLFHQVLSFEDGLKLVQLRAEALLFGAFGLLWALGSRVAGLPTPLRVSGFSV